MDVTYICPKPDAFYFLAPLWYLEFCIRVQWQDDKVSLKLNSLSFLHKTLCFVGCEIWRWQQLGLFELSLHLDILTLYLTAYLDTELLLSSSDPWPKVKVARVCGWHLESSWAL